MVSFEDPMFGVSEHMERIDEARAVLKQYFERLVMDIVQLWPIFGLLDATSMKFSRVMDISKRVWL